MGLSGTVSTVHMVLHNKPEPSRTQITGEGAVFLLLAVLPDTPVNRVKEKNANVKGTWAGKQERTLSVSKGCNDSGCLQTQADVVAHTEHSRTPGG